MGRVLLEDSLSCHKFIIFVALLVLLSGCVKSVDPRPIPRGVVPSPSPTPVNLDFRIVEGEPNDEQDHDSRLEWWYHSGHLKTEREREFGFHFVFHNRHCIQHHINHSLYPNLLHGHDDFLESFRLLFQSQINLIYIYKKYIFFKQ